MTRVFRFVTIVALTTLMQCIAGVADSSCSAKNETGGTCSVTCPSGQSASCSDTTGANPPICQCNPSNASQMSDFAMVNASVDTKLDHPDNRYAGGTGHVSDLLPTK